MRIVRTMNAGLIPLLFTGAASAQGGHMTNDGMGGFGWMGGYGGFWLPVLVVVLVAGLVAWVVSQKGK